MGKMKDFFMMILKVLSAPILVLLAGPFVIIFIAILSPGKCHESDEFIWELFI